MNAKMRVDIWSDIMCPFCYIGKRNFEKALAEFPAKDSVEVVWHSFQLNPDLTYQPNKSFYDYVAELKGQTREWSIQVHKTLVQTAKYAGLDYRLDQAKVTNSLDAHRLIQLAKKYNLTNDLEERFFRAYFTEGALLSDHQTLLTLSTETGLQPDVVKQVLQSDLYKDKVRQDAQRVRQMGATGVPFFVFNQTQAVSGAQQPKVFAQALAAAYEQWVQTKNEKIDIVGGAVCTPEGYCN
ncbi:DsbA family oxidoreductase [Larkinella rosea]|uniref:DsbA family oxidoreductase n=2 Tax=Larkinella rosea TaxID=2025312 RepID=A0A3P1C2Z3_9BACT|nr:DsbA family oxidoreductase [Larkinella rosea]